MFFSFLFLPAVVCQQMPFLHTLLFFFFLIGSFVTSWRTRALGVILVVGRFTTVSWFLCLWITVLTAVP